MEKLVEISRNYLRKYNKTYKRFILKNNDFKGNFYMFLGQRGVGKTTILVQMLLNIVNGNILNDEILYIPMDHIYLENFNMYDIVSEFSKFGVKYFSFDEVHKKENWAKDLKSIYDEYKDIKIFTSGSSLIKIYKESFDLSRRSVIVNVPGLSFREFLEISYPELKLYNYKTDEIFLNYEKISYEIVDYIKDKGYSILKHFKEYLKFGYFPYFTESSVEEYEIKLEQDINKIIYNDLISVYPDLNGKP